MIDIRGIGKRAPKRSSKTALTTQSRFEFEQIATIHSIAEDKVGAGTVGVNAKAHYARLGTGEIDSIDTITLTQST